ncbi:hypothetical protein [Gluconacetobacter asukensis]|uniref:hypothetical protein n=1 Tax=Gluconacetobacter asukensis TaxID=1017181 RepID=UPI0015FF3F7B|nr:hypothetical protein [Gluconacetobacter asukensis]
MTIERSLRFGVAVFLSMLLAHMFNYFLHEYAHSFMAWVLQRKENPFALHYGSASIDNILLQQQIDEDVDYEPIFASGRGWQAALIAAAGPLLANGGTALVCHRMIMRCVHPRALWWLVWIDAFSTFNVWSYAPLRVLTSHGDMALLARGLGVSVWVLFPFVTSFAGWLVWRFACHALPLAQKRLYPGDARTMFSMVVLAVSVGFFSISGLLGSYGSLCAVLGIVSFFLVMPALMAAQQAGASRRPVAPETL